MWQVRRCTGFVFLVAWPPGEVRALNPSGHRLCQPTNSKPVHCADMIDICISLSDSCRYDAHRTACRVAITLALFSDDLNVVPRHHSDLRVLVSPVWGPIGFSLPNPDRRGPHVYPTLCLRIVLSFVLPCVFSRLSRLPIGCATWFRASSRQGHVGVAPSQVPQMHTNFSH